MKEIILEIIPTHTDPTKGDIVQLSAIKLDNLKLVDRFDYRLTDSKIKNFDLLQMISYDKDSFIYKETTEQILEEFKKFINEDKLLIIDNRYTSNYLENINNERESIFNKLNMKFHDDIISDVIKKYNLEDSNYIVDLLYEAYIYENSQK